VGRATGGVRSKRRAAGKAVTARHSGGRLDGRTPKCLIIIKILKSDLP
jgi:hypothetical protein